MSSDRAPPERPEPAAEPDAEAIDDERHDPLSNITIAPGDRKTDSVKMLVVEAELACDEGKELDNPAKPRTESVGESFAEAIEDTDLVPAWTRPWEGSADE